MWRCLLVAAIGSEIFYGGGGLKHMIAHSPRTDILTVKGVQKAFFD